MVYPEGTWVRPVRSARARANHPGASRRRTRPVHGLRSSDSPAGCNRCDDPPMIAPLNVRRRSPAWLRRILPAQLERMIAAVDRVDRRCRCEAASRSAPARRACRTRRGVPARTASAAPTAGQMRVAKFVRAVRADEADSRAARDPPPAASASAAATCVAMRPPIDFPPMNSARRAAVDAVADGVDHGPIRSSRHRTAIGKPALLVRCRGS